MPPPVSRERPPPPPARGAKFEPCGPHPLRATPLLIAAPLPNGPRTACVLVTAQLSVCEFSAVPLGQTPRPLQEAAKQC